jgi:hypothetical protein
MKHAVLSVDGLKDTISQMEVASFRERAHAALLQKAQRGAVVRRVAIGYVKGSDDRIEKDPDARVGSTVDLIFRKFAELGSVRQVYFWLDQQQIQLPVVRGPEALREIVWQPARYHAVLSVLKNPVHAGAYGYGRRHPRRLGRDNPGYSPLGCLQMLTFAPGCASCNRPFPVETST